MRQHGDVRHAGAAQARERGRHLGHLHQRQQAFLHAHAAAGGKADQRNAFVERVFGGAREFLAADRTHRAAHVGELERAGDQRLGLEQAAHRDQRILLAGLLLRGDDAILVLFRIAEFQRIDRFEFGKQFLAAVLVEERRQTLARADRVVMAALRTHFKIALQLRPIQHRAAAFAFFPQAFRHLALGRALGADARRHQFLQPAHVVVFSSLHGTPGSTGARSLSRLAGSFARIIIALGIRRHSMPAAHRAPRESAQEIHRALRQTASGVVWFARCSTRALPITTASANSAIVAADAASRTPKPTATGTRVCDLDRGDARAHGVEIEAVRAGHAGKRDIV